MVLTEEEKRERKKIADKNYRDNNKEKIKQYRDNNKEKIKEQRKLYRENIREQLNEKSKKYYENNTEKIKKKRKIYTKTPKGIKSGIISNWKQAGLIYEDYDSLYGHYLNANNCDECGIKFGKYGGGISDWKCMDHCHKTGAFRNFLCNTCNLRRR